MRQQMRMYLRDGVHRDGDHDQQAGAAKIERDGILRNQDFGQEADHGQICRTYDSQTGQYE